VRKVENFLLFILRFD